MKTSVLPLLLAAVITGNTTSSTRVKTSVSGENATVHTSVTTTVNGETVTVSGDEPGITEVSNINGTITITKNGEPITPAITPLSPDRAKQPGTASPPGAIHFTPAVTDHTKTRYSLYDSLRQRMASIYRHFATILDKFR